LVRIIKILIDIGTQLLRDCFNILIVKPKGLSRNIYRNKGELFDEILNDPRTFAKLLPEQKVKLKNGDISKFGISLFFCGLQAFFETK